MLVKKILLYQGLKAINRLTNKPTILLYIIVKKYVT